MIWKIDYTGRFPQRPHWEVDELERLCGERTVPFLETRFGQAPARLPTDALTVLIECEAEVLDLEADLRRSRRDSWCDYFQPGREATSADQSPPQPRVAAC